MLVNNVVAMLQLEGIDFARKLEMCQPVANSLVHLLFGHATIVEVRVKDRKRRARGRPDDLCRTPNTDKP